jgi:hypothetical protein
MRVNKRYGAIAAVLTAGIILGACGDENKAAEQRRRAVRERAEAFGRAEGAAPTPNTKNFPLRKALVEFTERQDLVDHPWYVYVLADTGNVIGYYVARTVPINACNFLSSTQDVRDDDDGNVVLTAPSLDGIYYGGAGASSGCDAWFFFDSATNALIQIRGVNFFTADQPLRLDAQPITVAPNE